MEEVSVCHVDEEPGFALCGAVCVATSSAANKKPSRTEVFEGFWA